MAQIPTRRFRFASSLLSDEVLCARCVSSLSPPSLEIGMSEAARVAAQRTTTGRRSEQASPASDLPLALQEGWVSSRWMAHQKRQLPTPHFVRWALKAAPSRRGQSRMICLWNPGTTSPTLTRSRAPHAWVNQHLRIHAAPRSTKPGSIIELWTVAPPTCRDRPELTQQHVNIM